MKRIVSVLVLGLLVTASAQAELIINGGFETGDFTGWWTYAAEPENQSVVIDSAMSYEGSYSAQLNSATSTWSAQMGQSFDMGAGDWTLSFAYNAVTQTDWGSMGIAIDYYDADWNWLDYEWYSPFDGGPAPDPGNWVVVSNDYVAPEGTEHVGLKVEVANWATVNFDSFSAIPEPASMIILGLGSAIVFRCRKR